MRSQRALVPTMSGLRSARSRAIASGALGLLLLASVAALAGTTAVANPTGHSTLWLVIGFSAAAFAVTAVVAAPAVWRARDTRKRAEEALQESEGKYRRLVQDSIDGIAIVQGIEITFANRAILEMFGYESEEEMVGHPFTDSVSPEYRQLLVERAYARHNGEKVPHRYEFKALRKDGSEFDAEISIGRITYQGSAASQAVVRNISERKRAEEAVQKVREDIESRVERRVQEVNGYGLTFRELTALHLVAAGKADKEIATVLGISPLTAHKHLANILDKMGAASRTEAGVRAIREGLLD